MEVAYFRKTLFQVQINKIFGALIARKAACLDDKHLVCRLIYRDYYVQAETPDRTSFPVFLFQ